MSDSEEDHFGDGGSSGYKTPVVRSPTPEPRTGSRASRRSRSERSEERSCSRSRSPRRNGDVEALRAENEALKTQLRKMSTICRQQKEKIEALEKQMDSQHRESMAKLEAITGLLTKEAPPISREKHPVSPPERMETESIPQGEEKGPPKEDKDKAKKTQPAPEVRAPPVAGPSNSQALAEIPKEGPKPPKVPPIVLRNKDNWNAVSAQIKAAGVAYSKARLISDGIQILPTTVSDYRKLVRMLSETKQEYHTYSLPQDKLLRVVLRGLPDGIPLEDVKEDLLDQGFSPVSIQRMRSRRTKRTMPLVLVQVPEKDSKALDITRCCGLVVRAEPQKAAPAVSQCHRCQRFGHSQSNCSASPKCVKCGASHHSGDCKKAPTTPAKCANCTGPHPASYKGCPKFPKRKAPKPAPARQAPAQIQAQPAQKPKTTPAKSFADAAKNYPGPGKQSKTNTSASLPTAHAATNDLTAMLAQMQQMCAAMSAFFAQMPALSRK